MLSTDVLISIFQSVEFVGRKVSVVLVFMCLYVYRRYINVVIFASLTFVLST